MLRLAALPLLAAPAAATVLIFEYPGLNGDPVPQDYGDRVAAAAMGDFMYGLDHGLTPHVVADYFGTAGAKRWDTGYGDLVNVLYPESEGSALLRITLTADPGWLVSLHGFDLGGYPGADYTISALRVLDGAGALLLEESGVLVRGATADGLGRRHTSFDFAEPFTAQTIVIEFETGPLGGASDNIGIDNIAFSQVPAPASLPLAALALLATRRRR